MLFQSRQITETAPFSRERQSLKTAFAGLSGEKAVRIGILTNPRSGGNRKDGNAIRNFLAGRPELLHHNVVTPAEVDAALAELANQDVDVVVINGGDGTAQAALTTLRRRELFSRPPLLALLQAGTSSMLSRDVGLRGRPVAALNRLVAWTGRPAAERVRAVHQRCALEIHRPEEQQPLCGMFFGTGAIHQGIQLFHDRLNPRGRRGELMPGLILARMVLAVLTGNTRLVPPRPIAYTIDGEAPQAGERLFLLASTLERLFLGLHPYWGREEGPIHVTTVNSPPKRFLPTLPFLLKGLRCPWATPQEGYISHNARRLKLAMSGGFTIDGELFHTAGPLEIGTTDPYPFLRL